MLVSGALKTATPSSDTRFPLSAYLLPTIIYPLWHLAAPEGAVDPWAAWWVVGASFVVVALLSRWLPAVERRTRELLALCTAFVTLHLFVLASVNDMQPFYAVGSALAIMTASFSIRSKPVLIAYGVFVALLGATLFALAPDLRKLAYWGGLLPFVAFAYQRLSVQLSAAELTRRYQETLEERVVERTAKLTEANRRLRRGVEQKALLERELRFSQKMEAVGLLAGGVAHDFNNRLTTIGVYAELLLEGLPADSPLRREVSQIQRAERQAASLTRQLLTFSRRGDVRADVLDLHAVVEEMVSLLRHLVGEDVRLVWIPGQGAQGIRVDREEVEQVLVNLTANARDAMPSGGELVIETSALTREELRGRDLPSSLTSDAYVLLSMSDTGVGMDAETCARAFDPFFTRKPIDQGTGLGLSFVYGVVQNGGGHVRVMSEPGKGACFELYWPRAAVPKTLEARPAASVEPAGGNERILLGEDEAGLRRALHRTLADRGYSVTDAANGEVALDIATVEEGRFDLVVSDVVMPRMGGLELVEKLGERWPGTKVLLISGQLAHPSLRERALPPDVPLLPKPFLPRELVAKVREALDRP